MEESCYATATPAFQVSHSRSIYLAGQIWRGRNDAAVIGLLGSRLIAQSFQRSA